MPQAPLNLKGISYHALHTAEGLTQWDAQFLSFLQAEQPTLHDQLLAYRNEHTFSSRDESYFLIALAPWVESFVAAQFDIEDAVCALQTRTLSHDPIFAFQAFYVKRQAKRTLGQLDALPDFIALDQWLGDALAKAGLTHPDRELAVAKYGQQLLEAPEKNAHEIDQLVLWCVGALTTEVGQHATHRWASLRLPQKLNFENLVPVTPLPDDAFGRLQGHPEQFRHRDGFGLTDPRMSQREALHEVHYCVYCHKNDGDYCSTGFPVKRDAPEMGFKLNPVGDTLTGCPLEEKISEMHALKRDGYSIAALAMVMVDNPMCPATGHRICNDCMKACIYQKQDPVNIPEVETRVLTDVLALPWGVEIYDLFTRWNPLRKAQYLPKFYNGLKVLVMGMGPAGFTLAHHLLMEGFAVVGVDGLKIEPFPEHLLSKPIRSYDTLVEKLDERVMSGFGGVAEYGITVRWDKNFLKLIYISLLRRQYFQIFGSVRFGGTLTVEDAWALGFDHLAIAVGAGLPRELNIPNSLAPGMRQANDFLMALQLTGAAKTSSLANLQMRLPAVVIGGGLTGVDTATEAQAYYLVQIEKVRQQYETLCATWGETRVRSAFDAQSLMVLDEFLAHAQALEAERLAAAKADREPDLIRLIRQWGGVTIVYRRTMQASPAYRRNHEELTKAFEEGIYYAEGLEPTGVELDAFGWCQALVCRERILDESGDWMLTDETIQLPARSIFVATGAKPNIAYYFEHKGAFEKTGFEYQRYALVADRLEKIEQLGHVKMAQFGAFTSYDQSGHQRVSFLGDTHPIFHGSVVKAIASAKRIYPKIVEALQSKIQIGQAQTYQAFRSTIQRLFSAEVVRVVRHAPDCVEVFVRAPMAAQHFKPGQFYRLQNYERVALKVGGTRLQTEAMALIGIPSEHAADTLSFLVIEKGASARLVSTFAPGDPVSLMGPTGVRTKISDTPETILLVGGPLAVPYLRSIAPSLREKGSRVIFVGCFETPNAVFCRKTIQAAADAVCWVTEKDGCVEALRPQDVAYQTDCVSALLAYAEDTQAMCLLDEIDRVLIVGGRRLVQSMGRARAGALKPYFSEQVTFEASVFGPMQCMLKGVCAECLQWQVDPVTQKRTKAVYACSWQNQPIEKIDLHNMDERLVQNHMQETLTDLWLRYLFEMYTPDRV